MADILNGKRFPAWPKMEALTVALLVFARTEVTKSEIARVRELWLAVKYDDGAGAPPIQFVGGPTGEAFAGEHVPATDSELGDLFLKALEGFESEVGPTDKSGRSPHEEQIKQVTRIRDGESKFDDLHVRFVSQNSPGPGMFEVDYLSGMLQITINKQHPLGESILRVLAYGDEHSSNVIKNLLASWARMEDEIPGDKPRGRVANIRNDWGRYARDLSAHDNDDDYYA
ncbi:hypothetical protein [Streptomyces sp. NPDC060010]|uniref:hypothetical protein n=1 Tax=Streptomyces sp. NPDC060010 TaxID=3347036 RepID=UPI0036B81A4B